MLISSGATLWKETFAFTKTPLDDSTCPIRTTRPEVIVFSRHATNYIIIYCVRSPTHVYSLTTNPQSIQCASRIVHTSCQVYLKMNAYTLRKTLLSNKAGPTFIGTFSTNFICIAPFCSYIHRLWASVNTQVYYSIRCSFVELLSTCSF